MQHPGLAAKPKARLVSLLQMARRGLSISASRPRHTLQLYEVPGFGSCGSVSISGHPSLEALDDTDGSIQTPKACMNRCGGTTCLGQLQQLGRINTTCAAMPLRLRLRLVLHRDQRGRASVQARFPTDDGFGLWSWPDDAVATTERTFDVLPDALYRWAPHPVPPISYVRTDQRVPCTDEGPTLTSSRGCS